MISKIILALVMVKVTEFDNDNGWNDNNKYNNNWTVTVNNYDKEDNDTVFNNDHKKIINKISIIKTK